MRPLFRNKSKNRIYRRVRRKERTVCAGSLRRVNCGLWVWGE